MAGRTVDDVYFVELFHENYRHVRAFVVRRLNDRSGADDVVSETFLVAWRRFEQVPRDPREALLWLYRVAMYSVMNAERGSRRRRALQEQIQRTVPGSGWQRERAVIHDEESDALASVFATLSKADRTILLLAAWEGLRPAELAVVLECSVAAATTRLSRARARFEDAVAAELRVGQDHGGERPR